MRNKHEGAAAVQSVVSASTILSESNKLTVLEKERVWSCDQISGSLMKEDLSEFPDRSRLLAIGGHHRVTCVARHCIRRATVRGIVS